MNVLVQNMLNAGLKPNTNKLLKFKILHKKYAQIPQMNFLSAKQTISKPAHTVKIMQSPIMLFCLVGKDTLKFQAYRSSTL